MKRLLLVAFILTACGQRVNVTEEPLVCRKHRVVVEGKTEIHKLCFPKSSPNA